MAKARVFLVWSPKSNEVLYKETVKILEALDEGVTVAVAPDWTITGSNNVLEELKVAYKYSKKHLGGKITPHQLFKMSTSDAAKVAGVEERLGSIAFGYAADFFLAPKLDAESIREPSKDFSKAYSSRLYRRCSSIRRSGRTREMGAGRFSGQD